MILHAPSKLEGELILSVACDKIRRFRKLRTAKSSNHHLKPNYIYIYITYDRLLAHIARYISDPRYTVHPFIPCIFRFPRDARYIEDWLYYDFYFIMIIF